MCRHSDEIAKNSIGRIRYCKYCQQIEMQLESIVSYMNYTRYANLYLSLVEIKESVTIYDDGDFNDKLLITSPIKDTYFSFTLEQINEVLELFQESFLMLEVNMILNE